MTCLMVLLFISTKHYQNMYKGIEVIERDDFGFRRDSYITKKKVRVVSLAHDMPAGPPLHLYQILSYYLNKYSGYNEL